MAIPKVSVIMPSLNVGEYIRECIESAVNQTLKEIEIICVDAGSTDGTLEILREYEKKDPRVTVILSDKKSYGYQMNLGFKAAKGEYLAILETDDYILPDMYETLCPIADKYQLDVLKADFRIFVGEGSAREFTYRPMINDKAYYNRVIDPSQDLKAFQANNVSWAGIYRMDFLREHEIYHNESPGASFQDNGFWIQVFSQAHRVMFYDKPFYMLRRDNPNSSVKSREKVYCICEEYDFIRNVLKKDPELEKKFAPVCARYRFSNYEWTVDRVADEFKREFLHRFAEDFKKIEAAGELDRTLFSDQAWERLHAIMGDPERYYFERVAKLLPVNETSMTAKSGRIITWIPRMLRGGLRCLREHGFSYTMERVLIHLRLKKGKNKSLPAGNVSQPLPAKPPAVKKDYDFYSKLPPERYPEELKLWYRRVMGTELNLETPRTFNEKIQWMKLYDSTPTKTLLADKYLVRDWVKEKIGEEYLVPLLGVWDSFDEIDFDKLPDRFVLKANHGSGWNIIVKDKAAFDRSDGKKKFDEWMQKNFAFCAGLELHYMNIPPKIIAEAYIEKLAYISDYKFMFFHDELKFLWVDTERYIDHKQTLFTPQWERIRKRVTATPPAEEDPKKPEVFDKMLEIAKKLAEGFPHVRVDLYEDEGKIYFGEMTFTPWSGTGEFCPEEFGYEVGSWLTLPEKKPMPKREC